jgi:hypothetical protein
MQRPILSPGVVFSLPYGNDRFVGKHLDRKGIFMDFLGYP